MKHKKPENPISVVAIGDAHDDPKIPQDRFTWIGRFIAEKRPSHVIQIGDLMTMDSLNTHIPNETFHGRLKGVYLEDIASGNKALQALNRACKSFKGPRHIVLGNHERRLHLLEDAVPEIAGMMRHEFEQVLSNNGWSFSPYGEIHKLGNVGFVHAAINRLGKTFGGMNAELQIANQSNMDLVIGHSHVAKVHTAPKVGGDFVRVINLGCALPQGHIEDYAKHSQTGWTWGAWHLEIWDGHIQSWEFVSMKSLEQRYG